MGHRARSYLVTCPPVYMVIIAIVCLRTAGLGMSGRFEPYSDGGDDDDEDDNAGRNGDISDTLCDLQDCLELYQAAQDALQIQYYDAPVSPRHRPASSDNRARCEALRTFFLCIQNMSRTCLGNLIFHSSHRVVEKQMKSYNCSRQGPVYQPPVAIPPSLGDSNPVVPPPVSICTYKGSPERRYCAAFGDPHLWAFDGRHQTCRMIGAWPLIDNEYLSIQVSSEMLAAGGTAIVKVTVVIKEFRECSISDYVTYQATSPDPLPGTFDNGVVSFGVSSIVQLNDISPGRHIEIALRHADTIIVLRQVGRYYSVGVRMPSDIIRESHESADVQLCISRCPGSEHVDLKPTAASPSALRAAAETCRRHRVVDFFLDACVFDLIASSGDQNFSTMSAQALHDFVRLNPVASSQLHNRTTFRGSVKSGSRSPGPNSQLLYLLVTVSVTAAVLQFACDGGFLRTSRYFDVRWIGCS